MARRACVISILTLCLGLSMSACKSGPSSAAPDESATLRTQGRAHRGPAGPASPGIRGPGRADRESAGPRLADRRRLRLRQGPDQGDRALQHRSCGLHLAARAEPRARRRLPGRRYREDAPGLPMGGVLARGRRPGIRERCRPLRLFRGRPPRRAREVSRRQAGERRHAPGLPPPRRRSRNSDDGVYAFGRGSRGVYRQSARRDRALGRVPTALSIISAAWPRCRTLWVVEKLSLKSVSPDDPRSPVRASVSARAYFPL